MPIRDWFAGQALAGIVAAGFGRVPIDEAVSQSYAIADAMMAFRGGPPGDLQTGAVP